VTITPSQSGGAAPGLSASIILGDQSSQRDLVVDAGLVQVLQDDGSYRRLAYTPSQVDPKETRFFYRGRPRVVQSVGGVGGSVEGSQSEGTVLAPMNGQVVKVPVQVGDPVKSGDIVLILEAMKMENEVTAPISGIVVELSVCAGETVSPGQSLFLVEAKGPGE
jgi:biotin carboxyl carrier protein